MAPSPEERSMTRLEKAQAALEAAKDETAPTLYTRLLDIAQVQASIATAEALERIAARLDRAVTVDVLR